MRHETGCPPPEITPALIEYHKARAHALRARAFAAAGRWLVRALVRPFASGAGRVVHG